MQHLPEALAPLGAYRQFIAYRLEPHPDKPEKTVKKPVNVHTGRVADAHDADAWVDFDTAVAFAQTMGHPYGVGFVFTANDPFWFLDIDEAYRLHPGEDEPRWSDVATDLCNTLAGCAIEVSQSGRGLHIIGMGEVPPHGCDNKVLHCQFFTERRFVALTGTGATGSAAFNNPNIMAVVQRHFPLAPRGSEQDASWWVDEPVPEWRGPEDDMILLERAMRSASTAAVFGSKARFADLWEADGRVLGQFYPPDRVTDLFNASEADAALAQHLAFWTGNNAARIERLMRMSKLAREKWDQRDDYLPRTIRKACSMQREWLKDAPPAASPFEANLTNTPAAQEPIRVTDRTLLQPEEQVTFFAGCCYVTDEHKIMVPDGSLLDTSRFNARYGGRSFVMDAQNVRISRKAFEAFTESQVYRFPRADTTCFRPLRRPGEIVTEGGRTMVNTWVPINVPRVRGDATRFLQHVAKMLPDQRDQLILLGYMATVVQHQGHKLQWAPLIQGTTGNGKGILSLVVRKAIGRTYCHTPRASNLGNDFNAWLAGKTFYSVDEIYIEESRTDLLETLKPMITEADSQEVTKKGVDSITKEICGNFLFMTNHRNAMRLNRHDRRIAPFFTAQQEPEDLTRDGLTEDYFRDYVDWLEGRNAYAGQAPGYHIVADWLWTWEIPAEFDARKDVRAPKTTSTPAAINEGRGRVEQEIVEAIELGEIGFKGGWVSSKFLKQLIAGCGTRLPLSKHPEIMGSLGYVYHPALKDGRPNNIVMPDAARSRLYVRRDAQHLIALTSAGDAAAAYTKAQMEP